MMERKLYRGIMWPSMIANLLPPFPCGLGDATQHYMKHYGFILKSVWWVLLVIYHFVCGYYRKN